MRLDVYISEKYDFSRNKAQQVIKNGLVSVAGKKVEKAAYEVVNEEIVLEDDKSIEWVSRSAGKLDGFLDTLLSRGIMSHLSLDVCLDIGSSTGGFSQVLLSRGATHIDAVDVGTDQFHAKLRDNAKISLYEKTDIRDFRSEKIYTTIVCDVSFISLSEILPSISRLSSEDSLIFLLFKPQFEVGRESLRKTGVPKNEKIIEQALDRFRIVLQEGGFALLFEEKASVIGEAGNQEYMFFIKKKNILD